MPKLLRKLYAALTIGHVLDELNIFFKRDDASSAFLVHRLIRFNYLNRILRGNDE